MHDQIFRTIKKQLTVFVEIDALCTPLRDEIQNIPNFPTLKRLFFFQITADRNISFLQSVVYISMHASATRQHWVKRQMLQLKLPLIPLTTLCHVLLHPMFKRQPSNMTRWLTLGEASSVGIPFESMRTHALELARQVSAEGSMSTRLVGRALVNVCNQMVGQRSVNEFTDYANLQGQKENLEKIDFIGHSSYGHRKWQSLCMFLL